MTARRGPRRQPGFTLIEVLVAVAVLAIAMGAIMSAMTRYTANAVHLQERSMALFVAHNRLTEILLEPFDDIVPRDLPKAPEEAPKKKKKKEKKNLSLLSFGEEAAEEDKALQQISAKVVSSHDVLDDPRSAASLLWARPCGLRSLRSPSSIVLQAE